MSFTSEKTEKIISNLMRDIYSEPNVKSLLLSFPKDTPIRYKDLFDKSGLSDSKFKQAFDVLENYNIAEIAGVEEVSSLEAHQLLKLTKVGDFVQDYWTRINLSYSKLIYARNLEHVDELFEGK